MLVVLLLCAATVLAGPVGPAQACSCTGADTAQQFRDADAVFTGTLVDRTVTHPDFPVLSSGDPARHLFSVQRVLKGEVHEREAVLSADSGASCGLELVGDGPFAVFAHRIDGDLHAGLCDGSGPLTPELETALDRLTVPADGTSAADPAPAATLLPGGEPPPPLWTPGRLLLVAGLVGAGVLLAAARRRDRAGG